MRVRIPSLCPPDHSKVTHSAPVYVSGLYLDISSGGGGAELRFQEIREGGGKSRLAGCE